MLQVVEGLPDNVVGIVAKGRVTAADCDRVLKPLMQNWVEHDKVRLYYEIGCRFPGAAWEDLQPGIENISQWERVAVVSDVGWVRHTVNAPRFLIAAEVRVFSTSDAYQDCAWISLSQPVLKGCGNDKNSSSNRPCDHAGCNNAADVSLQRLRYVAWASDLPSSDL